MDFTSEEYDSSASDDISELGIDVDGADLLDPTDLEPLAIEGSREEPQAEDSSASARLHNLSWCECGKCRIMATVRECLCCTEMNAVVNRMSGSDKVCITDHPGFNTVCLDPWVLETAYYGYRHQYGAAIFAEDHAIPEKMRHTAYRQFVRWIWGWCGRERRIIIPSCAVTAIREKFTSAQYTGFKMPHD